MTINSNFELSADDSSFDNDEPSNELENNIADFDTDVMQNKHSKRNNKRTFEAKRKIELLKEERRLKKLLEDDWD